MAPQKPDYPFVTIDWLYEHLGDPEYIVADCRYNLFDLELGAREYSKGHVEGAYFLHMEKELTGPVKEHGGRHPLPRAESFKKSMNAIGLTPEKTVIAYDNDGSGAARLWWLLNYFGHSRVKILDGGYPLWAESGYPVSKEAPAGRTGNFEPVVNTEILATVDQVRTPPKGTTIIDSRARDRYLGKVEPIDPVAGHIPGAISIPYPEAVKDRAKFRSKDELEKLYAETGEDTIVYCGSGITSCVNFVALLSVGKKPKLYAGGWSDWISYRENEVATGNNP